MDVPFPTTYNQDLPAFPEGSGISGVNVRYEGQSYEITLAGGSASYSDADLERTMDKPWGHNEGDEVAVSLRMSFRGNVAPSEVMMDYYTEGRYGDASVLNGAFVVSTDGEYLNVRANGVDRNYPMREANCYVAVPYMEFIMQGVTYRKQAEKKYFTNGVNISTYLVDNSRKVDLLKAPNEEGSGFVGFTVIVYGVKEDYGEVKNPSFLLNISNPDGTVVRDITFESSSEEWGDSFMESYSAYTDADPNLESIGENSDMVYAVSLEGRVVVEYDGIYYDTGKTAPKVSDWETF